MIRLLSGGKDVGEIKESMEIPEGPPEKRKIWIRIVGTFVDPATGQEWEVNHAVIATEVVKS